MHSFEEMQLVTDRYLCKWTLRLAADIQTRLAESITEFMLFSDFNISEEDWRKLFIYAIQSKYEINFIEAIIFDKDLSVDLKQLDFSAVSAKRQACIKKKTYSWFKSLPATILKNHKVKVDIDSFSDLLSDEYAATQELNVPVFPDEFMEIADKLVFNWFQKIDDDFLDSHEIEKTNDDFNALKQMSLLELESLPEEKLKSINW